MAVVPSAGPVEHMGTVGICPNQIWKNVVFQKKLNNKYAKVFLVVNSFDSFIDIDCFEVNGPNQL